MDSKPRGVVDLPCWLVLCPSLSRIVRLRPGDGPGPRPMFHHGMVGSACWLVLCRSLSRIARRRPRHSRGFGLLRNTLARAASHVSSWDDRIGI
jgi:hypothetical protein